ncbi:MAG: hypothetical protein ACP5OP_07365 [Leptospirillia bacterium]
MGEGKKSETGEKSRGEGESGELIREIFRLFRESDRRLERIEATIHEVDERNRRAYESLAGCLKPDRKEWTLIAGGAAVVAVLLAVLFVALPRKAPSPSGPSSSGLARPDQMGEKDRYVYFVGRWYLGVRDRMSTSERKFLENYLKPFDNIDADLKARKEAGL